MRLLAADDAEQVGADLVGAALGGGVAGRAFLAEGGFASGDIGLGQQRRDRLQRSRCGGRTASRCGRFVDRFEHRFGRLRRVHDHARHLADDHGQQAGGDQAAGDLVELERIHPNSPSSRPLCALPGKRRCRWKLPRLSSASTMNAPCTVVSKRRSPEERGRTSQKTRKSRKNSAKILAIAAAMAYPETALAAPFPSRFPCPCRAIP